MIIKGFMNGVAFEEYIVLTKGARRGWYFRTRKQYVQRPRGPLAAPAATPESALTEFAK